MTKLQELMREIMKYGPISKKELQEHTGISWGMVSALTNQLVDEKYIVSSVRQGSDVGRKAEEFDVNPSDHLCIGIDLSQHGLVGVVTDLRGRVAKQLECTFQNPEKDTVLEEIYKMVEAFLKAFRRKKIWGIGFSVQGIVEIYEGVSVLISGIEGWRDIPLKDLLEQKYMLPVFTEHDPNCVMLAERAVGCLKNRQVREATLLSFDPRIGAGVSVTTRGQLCHGVRGRAGEIGWNPVDITSDGDWHHFEDYLYPGGILQMYRGLTGKNLSYEEFEEGLRQEDPDCIRVYEKLGQYFGFALAVANNYLNPEYIVLDIAGYQQGVLFREISRLVKKVSFDPDVQILHSQQNMPMKAIGGALIISEKAVSPL